MRELMIILSLLFLAVSCENPKTDLDGLEDLDNLIEEDDGTGEEKQWYYVSGPFDNLTDEIPEEIEVSETELTLDGIGFAIKDGYLEVGRNHYSYRNTGTELTISGPDFVIVFALR